jgi:hypothetical protein
MHDMNKITKKNLNLSFGVGTRSIERKEELNSYI